MALPAESAAARLGWREEARQDRLVRAQIEREREAARARARIEERDAAEARWIARADARRAARAAIRAARAARWHSLAAWASGHVVDLLFVPVIGVPALLAWTAMSAFGARLYGPAGRSLPAFSEGAMWAFAAATTITAHRHPGRPVWHLRTGIGVFAAFGAALNYVHGLTMPPVPGLPSGPVTGAVMAAVSVAGVTAHQLVTAGPRHTRAKPPGKAVTAGTPLGLDAVVAAREGAGLPAPDYPLTAPGTVPMGAPGGVPDGDPQTAPAPASARTPGAGRQRTRSRTSNRTRSAPVTAGDAEREFTPELAAGAVPSVREVRKRMHVGQPRAQELRGHLASLAAASMNGHRPADPGKEADPDGAPD